MRLPGGAAKHHCAQEPTLGPKRRCADMAANPPQKGTCGAHRCALAKSFSYVTTMLKQLAMGMG